MCTDSERASHARKVLEHLLLANGSYHHHKEIMAHGGVALQIAMFGWIMTRDTWPPLWLGKPGAFVGVLIIWLVLHVYIRWQLRLRRWAATQVDGLRRTLGRWSTRDIEPNELRAYEDGANGQSLRDYWLDLLFPRFGLTLPADDGKRDYPTGLVSDLLLVGNDEDRRQRLFLVEFLFFVGSMIMLVVVVLRTVVGEGTVAVNGQLSQGGDIWSVLRTFIQVTALLQVFASSVFLIKGVVGMSVKDIAELSKTGYGYTLGDAKNLAGQKSNTTVGFVLLLVSLVMQMINLLWPMRLDDFGVNPVGLIIAIVVSIGIFVIGYKISHCLEKKWYSKAKDILEAKEESEGEKQ